MENTTRQSSHTISLLLHLTFWAVIGLVHVLVFWLAFDSGQLLTRALSNLALLAFIFYFNAKILVNKILEKKQYVLFGMSAVALIVLMVPLRAAANMMFPPPKANLPVLNMEQAFRVVALVTNLGMVLFSTLYQVLVNRLAEERRTMAMMHQQDEAQLQFLKAQINPHFLFNTLHNIYSLAVARSEKTADMVLKLSQLLRFVIYDGQEKQVSLKKEMEQLGHFIDLFQMRSEMPLNISFKKKGNFEGATIDPMILIPLVENCFKHCDFETNENAFMKIESSLANGHLVFKTTNSKNDNDQQKDRTGGVGLSNIKKRLQLNHPGNFKLEVNDKKHIFETECHLPVVRRTMDGGRWTADDRR